MIRFRSIANDQVGYAWGWNSDSYRNSSHVSYHAWEYATYGDGLTQHSPMYGLRPESTIDFLYSLGDHLLHNPDRFGDASSGWAYDEPEQTIAFLASVKWKEGKPRYYSFNDRKVSSTDSKRYDKRWAEIPEWANGTLTSVYRLFFNNLPMDRFRQIHLLVQIKEWFYNNTTSVWSIHGQDEFSWLIELAPGHDKWDCWGSVVQAYDTVDRQVRAHHLKRSVGNSIERYREQLNAKGGK